MTTLLETPAAPSAPEYRSPPAGAPAVHVHIEETLLPEHRPLDLCTALREIHGDDVFLLESPQGPQQDRTSAVIGYDRLAEIRVHPGHITITGTEAVADALLTVADGLGLSPSATGSLPIDRPGQALELLRAVQNLFALHTAQSPDTYVFGFLATLGYGTAWHLEDLPPRKGAAGPDCVLTLYRNTVRYDTSTGEALHFRALAEEFPQPAPFDIVAAARTAADAVEEPVPAAPAPLSVRDSTDRETFLARAGRCLEHIGVGDIYQIQIGHRIDVTTPLTPLDAYRRLRDRNPSPYMYLVPHAGTTLIGASPELLFRTEGDRIVMRPIAGTAPRSGDTGTDARRVTELLASEKERAEHVMLVDLCRNDVGRVCVPRTLTAGRLMEVEEFSHVYHLVSTVEGRLAPDADVWSALRATFPAGTVTGAPKIRAMEIIEGLETEPRGMYAGAVGLVDVRGRGQFALCIRTIVRDGPVYSTQSCAGIVADSSPVAEWRETLHKMGAAYWALTGEELTAVAEAGDLPVTVRRGPDGAPLEGESR
ncbi:anthranilate synthase component I family protein [Streptomyces sp. NPDC096323]|uniref:anthranilate synthase component I family protein n=1 Tax=Streptomyces sp. NPDC096323 TaxID=3155822 RepID=UPI0033238A2D